jgi:hypothetical protein
MGGRAGGGAGMGSGARGGGLSSQQREFLETTMMLSPNIQYKANLVGVKGYKGVTDERVASELQEAVKMYAKEIGLAEPVNIHIETLPKGRRGVSQATGYIALSKNYFGGSYEKTMKGAMDYIKSGGSVEVSRPIMKTLHHELGHKTYNYLSSSQKSAVGAIFSKFSSSKSTPKGWGSYSKHSAEEFFAEGMAKSLTGKSDSYTKALRKLLK